MMKKTVFSLLIVATLSTFYSFINLTSLPPVSYRSTIKTIIVDAGHGIMRGGGKNGAPGRYSHEDEICLAIAKKLVADIKRTMPDVRVIETRPTENIVPLHERADIANRNKGDLFISIHCNSADPIRERKLEGYRTVVRYTGKGKKRKKITSKEPVYKTYSRPNPAKGTETYIWGSHKNGSKEEAVAKSENAAILQEADYKNVYGDVDVNSTDFMILANVRTKQYFQRSYSLATYVQDELQKIGRIDRDVRQRQTGIWVLQATAMPSILVETGYISNPEEEDYLNSENGQQQISNAIVEAVRYYKGELEKPKNNDNSQSGNSLPIIGKDIVKAVAALRKEG
jgi:N-acetylmuramoyl-L-alanine amidase